MRIFTKMLLVACLTMLATNSSFAYYSKGIATVKATREGEDENCGLIDISMTSKLTNDWSLSNEVLQDWLWHDHYYYLYAEAKNGWKFSKWTKNGELLSEDPKYTDKSYATSSNKNNRTVFNYVAWFDPVYVNVETSGTGTGTASISNEINYTGDVVTVTAVPADGMNFLGWFEDGADAPVSEDLAYTFTVTVPMTLTAKFDKKNYYSKGTATVKASREGEDGNCGMIDISTASKNTEWSLSKEISQLQTSQDHSYYLYAKANDRWKFSRWTKNGEFLSNDPQTTDSFKAQSENENEPTTNNYAAWFDPQFVTVRTEGTGTASISNEINYTGDEVTVTAVPFEGMEFHGWFEDGAETPVSEDLSYTFTVTEPMTLTAKFDSFGSANKYYSIVKTKAVPAGFGKVYVKKGIGASESNRDYQESMDVTIEKRYSTSVEAVYLYAKAENGCRFVNWTLNDEVKSTKQDFETSCFALGKGTPYVYDFQAHFEPKYLKVASDGPGKGEIDKVINFPGDEVTLTATPDDGCEFVGWYDGDTCESTEPVYMRIVEENDDKTLTARFEIESGISSIRNENAKNGIIYDIYGRKVNTMNAGGIYIIDGKKVIR